MNLFTIIDGEKAILQKKGRFYQVDLYRLGDRLFAKQGSSFVGLQNFSQGTTDPDMTWREISVAVKPDATGRLLAP